MTKEELEKEAEEWLNKWEFCNKCDHKVECIEEHSYCHLVVIGAYVASAEPREGRISVLKQENDILRNRLSNIVNSEHHCMKDCEEKLKLLSEYVSDLYVLGCSAKKIAELVQAKIADILGGIEK